MSIADLDALVDRWVEAAYLEALPGVHGRFSPRRVDRG
jgi:hypothetical protein